MTLATRYTGVMKIWDPRGLLLARVKHEVNHLYLLHIKLAQSVCGPETFPWTGSTGRVVHAIIHVEFEAQILHDFVREAKLTK
jgi:hypothetical protein